MNTFIFVSYEFDQYTTTACCKQYIIIHSNFLYKLVIIPIYNINSKIIYSEPLPTFK